MHLTNFNFHLFVGTPFGLLFYRTPVKISAYLQVFLEGERAAKYLTSELKKELLHTTTFEITHRYNELAAELVSVVCQFSNILDFLQVSH